MTISKRRYITKSISEKNFFLIPPVIYLKLAFGSKNKRKKKFKVLKILNGFNFVANWVTKIFW